MPLKGMVRSRECERSLKNGTTVSAHLARGRFKPQEEDFVAKFRACAGRHLKEADVDPLQGLVMDIEKAGIHHGPDRGLRKGLALPRAGRGSLQSLLAGPNQAAGQE